MPPGAAAWDRRCASQRSYRFSAVAGIPEGGEKIAGGRSEAETAGLFGKSVCTLARVPVPESYRMPNSALPFRVEPVCGRIPGVVAFGLTPGYYLATLRVAPEFGHFGFSGHRYCTSEAGSAKGAHHTSPAQRAGSSAGRCQSAESAFHFNLPQNAHRIRSHALAPKGASVSSEAAPR